ncbi:hypothetical protein CAL26_05175 [Bordetella genomosp. 9]|uniref:Uncharacterized protein n=1 Tax=Bordetella genomosp. 9 TaxID=1416803 RepID=A0A261RP23_9BORD|nr:hypothetical protein [Bordetella genomosp. 9]OZI26715.1 hypothetical protein CAL26_05175 [Bordetella genomosp. 9]
MAYSPANPPVEYDAVWMRQELQKIREAMTGQQPFAYLDMQYVAPPKPREGMIALADGTQWNPGQGKGYYGYFGGQWVPSGLPVGTSATIAGKQPAGNYVTRGGNAVNVAWTAQGTTGALKLTIDTTNQNWLVNTLTGNVVQFGWDGSGLSVYIDGTRIGAVTTH